jgi:hypothetical protein
LNCDAITGGQRFLWKLMLPPFGYHFLNEPVAVGLPAGVRGLQLSADVLQDTPQLEVLLASSAGLQEFPAAVLACAGLRQLILSSNSISSLPVEVTQLTR